MTWSAWWDKDKLETILPQAYYHRINSEEEIGWPESSNHMFYNTALWIAENYYPDSWYFMEADTYPLKKYWFETMANEYEEVGKPYMGVISNTVRFRDDDYVVTGQHMTGTGIYPADFLTRCRAIHYLARDPWDIEIGPEVVPDCNNTKLIAHRWSSYGYYLEDGVIKISGSRAKSKFSSSHVQPIPPEAVVVHGCKDSSIYTLDLPLTLDARITLQKSVDKNILRGNLPES
jgi:hypothetical protein